MASYRLEYFDIRGRAEHIRIMFLMKGQEFEDVRLKQEEWPEKKSDKKG